MTFDKAKVRRWRRTVWREFTGMGFLPTHMHAPMVLAAIDAVGTGPTLIAELVGVSEEYVTKVLRRLRKQRVLQGQTLRIGWDSKDSGWMAVALDAMVATGDLTRPPDPRRSAAQKARAPETRTRKPQTKRTKAAVGMFTPKRVKSNPFYGLPEWEQTEKVAAGPAGDHD